MQQKVPCRLPTFVCGAGVWKGGRQGIQVGKVYLHPAPASAISPAHAPSPVPSPPSPDLPPSHDLPPSPPSAPRSEERSSNWERTGDTVREWVLTGKILFCCSCFCLASFFFYSFSCSASFPCSYSFSSSFYYLTTPHCRCFGFEADGRGKQEVAYY